MRRAGLAMLLAGLALPVLAEAPGQSLRPLPRPGAEPAAATPVLPEPEVRIVLASEFAPGASLRPLQRPATRVVPAQVASAVAAPAAPAAPAQGSEERGENRRGGGLFGFLRGNNRREEPETGAGRLCGVRGIEGERLQRIPGRLNGCGIDEPVRVTAINGISLSQRPTLNCEAARSLQDWLTGAVVPEVGRRGGGVASVRVIASYSCRTRNNVPGARLSEHATGSAIDIAGIGLADGSEITVLSDWGSGAEGRILRNLHQAACGRFGTVLGPNSDRYHQDHFHFDVASYRSGSYCR